MLSRQIEVVQAEVFLKESSCNRKLYSPVLSCTHGRKTKAGKIQFFVFYG